MNVFGLSVLLATLLFPRPNAAQDSLIHGLFRDHAVLQRNVPVGIWGMGSPGETITIAFAGTSATATVDAEGRWSARLPALEAGGPHTLEVSSSGGARQSASDLWIGDVFLCSGQSNMELPVNRTLNAPTEIRASGNERIRMLQIRKATSPAPVEWLSPDELWEPATPENVADWSAACYYFGRELERHLGIPIGLINSSWGGSDIRAWMSAESLAELGGYEEVLSLLHLYTDDPQSAQRTFGESWEAWWRSRSGGEPWQLGAGIDWPSTPAGLGDWKTWGIPELQNHHGMVWFRGSFELSETQAAHDAALKLGGIDEVDQTWLNGRIVGNTFGWGTERTYTIPSDILREGVNEVVVNVLNTWGSGGMLGIPKLLIDGEEVAIENWRFRMVPQEIGSPPRTPWESVGGRTTIHNAMVAPLQNVGLRGVLWYQGESNTGEADSYQSQLEALMSQWRRQFGAELPVLVVQLANYGLPPTAPVESGWAEIREAQRLATAFDENAGLAVTIDLGDVYDIHPANKQEVGRRLFRAARRVIYGEDVHPSGPVPTSATRQGDSIVVSFDYLEGSLVAYSHTAPIGFELCGDEGGSCRFVPARIDEDRVILEPAGEATRVRYCWADSPICTLYDESRLPAGPFEIPVSHE